MEHERQILSKSILVIGDVMLDMYYYGEVKRISPEAPVPVFKKKSERYVLGGAGNVAANLVAAGQQVSVMAVTGRDENGNHLREILKNFGINCDFLIESDRKTTVKIRFLAENNQQVLRFDEEDLSELNKKQYEELLNNFEKRIDEFSVILLSDYMKGFLEYEFTQKIIQLANEHNIPTVIDVKDSRCEKYKNAYLLKPNLNELRNLTGMRAENDKEIIVASQKMRDICRVNYVLTTCGAKGMVLVGLGSPFFIGAIEQKVFDVTGAGDTTIAYLSACIANGIELKKSVKIANCAAGIQVKKVGTSLVYWNEVWKYVTEHRRTALHKILTKEDVENFRKEFAGKKIVFTNGCFDILHIGHIRYLQKAAKLGDVLVLGLNSDDSVRRLKGPSRPINGEQDRAELLCALGFIDYVAIFDEDTPLELIKKIRPDVLVKGDDYRNKYVIGTNEVESWGGRLELLPFVKGKSTTNIIMAIEAEGINES